LLQIYSDDCYISYIGKGTEEKSCCRNNHEFTEMKDMYSVNTESCCYIDNWAHVSVKNRSHVYTRATLYLLEEGVHIQLEVLVVNSTPYSLLELLHHFLLV
jgi:hypothetical protein